MLFKKLQERSKVKFIRRENATKPLVILLSCSKTFQEIRHFKRRLDVKIGPKVSILSSCTLRGSLWLVNSKLDAKACVERTSSHVYSPPPPHTHTALCSLMTCPLSVWIIDNRAGDLRGSYKNGAHWVWASHKRRGATSHTDSKANRPLISSFSRRGNKSNSEDFSTFTHGNLTFTHDFKSIIWRRHGQNQLIYGRERLSRILPERRAFGFHY